MIHNPTTLEWLNATHKGKKYVTKGEAGEVLSVSIASINNYMVQDKNPLEFVKLGSNSKQGAVRISLESLAKFIDNLESSKDIQDE